MGVIRAFIAVDLSAQVQHELDVLEGRLKTELAGLPVRWAPVGNIHLTLKFLGDVSVANLEMLYGVLREEAGRCARFEISAAGLGVFPSYTRPKVIWAGVQAPPELSGLQKGVDQGTAHLGYPSEERKFSPHLTLGRVSNHASLSEARQIGEILAGIKAVELGKCVVETVNFYRSDLNPNGSIYTRLYAAALR